MLLSKATSNGLLMTTKAMVDLIEDCFGNGAKFVVTQRINQDLLESHLVNSVKGDGDAMLQQYQCLRIMYVASIVYGLV